MLSSITLTLVILLHMATLHPLLRIIQIQHAQEILIEIDLENASGGILAKTNVKTHMDCDAIIYSKTLCPC
jgi:hypothetical protein